MTRIDRSLEDAMIDGLEISVRPQNPKIPGSVYRPNPFVVFSVYHPQTGYLQFVANTNNLSDVTKVLDKLHWIYGERIDTAEHFEWFTEMLSDLGNMGDGLTLFYDEGEFVTQYDYIDDEADLGQCVEGRSNLGLESALDNMVTQIQEMKLI